MKNREGFVSNSSSSSFIVNKHYISGYQMDKAKKKAREEDWAVDDLGDVMKFSTGMDNFDMEAYMREIGVSKQAIQDDEW